MNFELSHIKKFATVLLLAAVITACAVPIQNNEAVAKKISAPLDRLAEREIKKPFGIKVSPGNSPTEPEHFTGYHTATDFEIFADEREKDVAVSAICTGKILQKRMAQGYGGVIVQACTLSGEPVTIVYGHVKLASISQKIGEELKAGAPFALLGSAWSADTGGERKHLHLGIKKGTQANIRGYVQTDAELAGWLDFEKLQP